MYTYVFRIYIQGVQKRWYQILTVCSTRENKPKSLNKQYSKNHLFPSYKAFSTIDVRCAFRSSQHTIRHAFSLKIEHVKKFQVYFVFVKCCLTIMRKCAGALSCMNHICCLRRREISSKSSGKSFSRK